MGKVPYFSSERIADGSWMIRNAFTAQTPALCYLIEGRDYALLIDTMMGWGNLRAYCETLTDKPIKVANTHAHPDHCGGNCHFDACYIHHRDISDLQEMLGYSREEVYEQARSQALEEYRADMALDDSFAEIKPMRVYPLYDGDIFDLGDRQVEVVELVGHTPGSVVLIDHSTRIAYTGDACNGNTLLEFDNCLPVACYMRSLLRFKERLGEFDRVFGGHEVFTDTGIFDEAIETVARVIAGTDAKCERPGMWGKPVLYAAEKVPGGYERADGKRFNMSYLPSNVFGDADDRHVIK